MTGRATDILTLLRGMLIEGQPGTGKSRLLEHYNMQLIEAGQGVCFVDPHGTSYRNILTRLAALSLTHPEIAERIVLIDPLCDNFSVGINPLDRYGKTTISQQAVNLTNAFMHVFEVDKNVVSRMAWLMTHVFMLLAEAGLSLYEFLNVLRDESFRKKLVTRFGSSETKNYFLDEFPKSQKDQNEWAQSTVNRVGNFFVNEDMKLMFGQLKSTINFRELIDTSKIVLVNLQVPILGDSGKLLGAMIVSQFLQAAFAREVDIPNENDRKPYFCSLDEWQTYTTEAVHIIVSQGRKYRIGVLAANQFLDQIENERVKEAMLDSAALLVSFRVGRKDAEELAKRIYNFDVDAVRGEEWRTKDLFGFKIPHREKIYRPLEAEKERYVQELANLPNRIFWVKQKDKPTAARQQTPDMPDPPETEAIRRARARIIELSGRRYARLKADVKKELEDERASYLESLFQSAKGRTDDDEDDNLSDFGAPPRAV